MKRQSNTFYAICSLFYYWIRSIVLLFVPKSLRYKSVVDDIVLITGGGSGLGRALALRFAKFGATVVIWDIDESSLNQTIKLAEKQLNVLIKGYVCDITDRQSVYETAQKVTQEIGTVSILVNNAGVLYGKSLLELSDEKIINTFGVNILSNFWTVKAFLPNMLNQNKGHIVNIASICGLTGFVQMTDYCASKHAVIGFTESLRLELMGRELNQIKTTVVLPTFFNTDLITGVKSTAAITVFDKNRVADEIIDSVLTDEEMIIIPKTFGLLFMLKSIIPIKSYNRLYEIFGGFQIMNGFQGR